MQVDFYLLNTQETEDGERFVCRLTEKVFHQHHRIFINTGNQSTSARLDKLLWTFNQGSFIPHALATSTTRFSDEKIIIGHQEIPTTASDVLINMAADVPPAHAQFSRIAEIVYNTEEHKQVSRNRYRYYRDQGYTTSSHEITAR